MNKWDERFIRMAEQTATWSSCLRRNVGAVIVKERRVIATGYNGAPAGISSCVDRKECMKNALHAQSGTMHELCYANHAEQNAILQAAKLGISIEGATMYCTHKPCSICMKMIINAGIKEVYYKNEYVDRFSDDLLKMSNIQCQQVVDLKDEIQSLDPIDACEKLLDLARIDDKDVIIAALNELKFFDAPASCSHHLAYTGGLFIHSVNVALNLYKYTQNECLTWQNYRSPIMIGLLHDLCKCDQYVKLSTNGYAWNKSADSRHGAKSKELAKILLPDLTEEEAACIEFHMGAFVDKLQWSNYSEAVQKFPNVAWTHQADMLATNVDER